MMDKFFAENLAPLADLSTEPWTWKQDTALGRELSNTSLREFQRAAEIRDAFFPPGAPAPQVTLTDHPDLAQSGGRRRRCSTSTAR